MSRDLITQVSLQPIVDFNMLNSKIKHSQSENDNNKPVSKKNFFFVNLRNLVILKKKEGALFSLFHKYELHQAIA